MHKFLNKFTQYCSYIVYCFFGIIVSYLFLLSIFSTSYISPSSHQNMEFVYYVPDNAFLHLGIILIFSAICISCIHFLSHNKIFDTIIIHMANYTPVFVMITGMWWIICTKNTPFPFADQAHILHIASQMYNGDFSAFFPGQYMNTYPNQNGIVLLIYMLIPFTGGFNYMFFQFINVLSLALIVFTVQRIAYALTDSRKLAAISCISTVLFIPLFLYITFVYGTLIGLSLTFLSFCLILEHIKQNNAYKLAGAVVAIILSVFVKSNYLIALIAFILILFVDVIRRSHRSSFIALLLIIPLYLTASFFLTTTLEKITGCEPSDGLPASSFIALGLDERENNPPGWYTDKFVSIYTESNGNYDAADSYSKEFINNRIKYFFDNPDYMLHFFARKTASQWNIPTFQSFWLYRRNALVSNEFINHTDITDRILGISGHTALYRTLLTVFNIVQTLVLFGALMYIVYIFAKPSGNIDHTQLLIPLFFVGGFIFHLFWEAKAQYALPYFTTLIPLAVIGFKKFIYEVYSIIVHKGKLLSPATISFVIILIIVLLIYVLPLSINDELFKIIENAEIYYSSEF